MLIRRCSAFRDGVERLGSLSCNVECDFRKSVEVFFAGARPQRPDGRKRELLRAFAIVRLAGHSQRSSRLREGCCNLGAGSADDCAGLQRSSGQRAAALHRGLAVFDRLENGFADEPRYLEAARRIADVAGKAAKCQGIERVARIKALPEAPTNDRRGADVGKLVVQQHEAIEEIERRRDGKRIGRIAAVGRTRPEQQARPYRIACVRNRETLGNNPSRDGVERNDDLAKIALEGRAMRAQRYHADSCDGHTGGGRRSVK